MQRVRVYTQMCHELFAIAMEYIFSTQVGFTYVGNWPEEVPFDEFETVSPAMATDILITDTLSIDDPEQSTVATLKQQWPGLRIMLLLPIGADESTIVKALRSRADGFVFQSATRDVIVRSAQTIADGQSFLQPDITPVVLEELRKARYPVYEPDVSIQLTEREHMLLQLSADGLSNQRISEVLYVHEKTVRNMWSLLFQKLGVSDRTQAVLWAIRTGQAELR